jgi:uncharacterized repeat protein (TIGR01451 family)
VTKVCKPDTTIYANQPIDCTVYVDNSGPSDARGVVLTDVVQSNPSVPVVISNFPTPACSLSGQTLTCNLAIVPAATTADPGRKTISYRMVTQEGTDIDNVASVRSDTPDPVAANNSTSVSLTVQALADLRLTENVATPASTVAGQDLTYSLKVDNLGPSTAKNVVIKDTLPAGVTVQSVVSSIGSCTAGAPGNPLNPTTCALGTVGISDHPTMTVVVHVLPDTVGPLSYSARVSSATFDGNTGNNLSTATTSVNQQANLGDGVAGIGARGPDADLQDDGDQCRAIGRPGHDGHAEPAGRRDVHRLPPRRRDRQLRTPDSVAARVLTGDAGARPECGRVCGHTRGAVGPEADRPHVERDRRDLRGGLLAGQRHNVRVRHRGYSG